MTLVTLVFLLNGIVSLLHFEHSYAREDTKESNTDSRFLKLLLRSGRYEEFSQLIQNENVDLEKPEDDRDFNDVIIKSEQMEEERQGINFANKPDKKWKNNVVPYVIHTEGYSDNDIKIIEKSIDSFNSRVENIQYKKRTTQKDYAVFAAGDDGCYSNLGRVGGANAIRLQPSSCLKEGIIQHQMIHTLGFTHEQNRPDRDDYIEIQYDNIPEAWRAQYRKVNSDDFSNVGKYDYYSVMHYPFRAPDTGKPAFRILEKGIATSGIGQRLTMTREDAAKIDELYRGRVLW